MEESTSREKILKKVRNALISKHENPFQSTEFDSNIYQKTVDPLDISFAKSFTEADGQFVYCETSADFPKNLKLLMEQRGWTEVFCPDKSIHLALENVKIPFKFAEEDLLQMKVGLTRCEFLISRLGSIMVSSKQVEGRRLNAYPEIHIVLGFTSQLVNDLKDALNGIQKRYQNNLPSMISIITGPSRTADIEKTIVKGAHGPKELFLFLIDDAIAAS